MSGPSRTLVLTICAAHPVPGDDQPRLMRIPGTTGVFPLDALVCGLQPGHDGNHADIEYLVTWDDEIAAAEES